MVVDMPNPVGQDFPATLTVEEFARVFRIHTGTVLRAIDRGQIVAVKIGNRYRISTSEMRRWLNGELLPAA